MLVCVVCSVSDVLSASAKGFLSDAHGAMKDCQVLCQRRGRSNARRIRVGTVVISCYMYYNYHDYYHYYYKCYNYYY